MSVKKWYSEDVKGEVKEHYRYA